MNLWLPGTILLFFIGGTNKHAHGFMGVISWEAWVLVRQCHQQHSATQRIWFSFQLKYIFSWPSTTTSFVSHCLFTMNVITIHFNTTLDSVLHSLLTMYSIFNLDRVALWFVFEFAFNLLHFNSRSLIMICLVQVHFNVKLDLAWHSLLFYYTLNSNRMLFELSFLFYIKLPWYLISTSCTLCFAFSVA